jgi:hypothetical protein
MEIDVAYTELQARRYVCSPRCPVCVVECDDMIVHPSTRKQTTLDARILRLSQFFCTLEPIHFLRRDGCDFAHCHIKRGKNI